MADRLGVSITGLYHHIEDKDDLLRLAAEYSATRLRLPEDRGQHWARWLRDWATYSRDAFLAEPGLLGQYLGGAISAEVVADKFDTALGLLVRQGFSVREAQAAFELVSSLAVGSAVSAIRERRAGEAGRSVAAEQLRVLAEHDPTDLVHLRELLDDPSPRASFASQLRPVLVGIAVQRGENPDAVAALIDQPGRDRTR